MHTLIVQKPIVYCTGKHLVSNTQHRSENKRTQNISRNIRLTVWRVRWRLISVLSHDLLEKKSSKRFYSIQYLDDVTHCDWLIFFKINT